MSGLWAPNGRQGSSSGGLCQTLSPPGLVLSIFLPAQKSHPIPSLLFPTFTSTHLLLASSWGSFCSFDRAAHTSLLALGLQCQHWDQDANSILKTGYGWWVDLLVFWKVASVICIWRIKIAYQIYKIAHYVYMTVHAELAWRQCCNAFTDPSFLDVSCMTL